VGRGKGERIYSDKSPAANLNLNFEEDLKRKFQKYWEYIVKIH
jgi:hypothetical protein